MAINSELLRNNKFFKKPLYSLSRNRSKKVVSKISKYLKNGDSVLDIGAGTCNICEILNKKKFNATPLDIKNLSLVDKIKPVIYNGEIIPFNNDNFDISLILFVLHHTDEPEKIILEAMRVSKRIIIAEDIYTNIFNKYLTYTADCFLNQEFINHPHSNKSDAEWKSLFKKFGLELKETQYKNWHFGIKHAIYYLQK